MQDRIEGLKQGLKYAFSIAAVLEVGEMLIAKSYHLQPLDGFETGLIAGIGLGIAAYVADTHGTVTLPGTADMLETVEQGDGKVTFLHSTLPGQHP